MGRRKLPFYENVEISSAGGEGKALARINEKVVFVPFVVPGDVVDLQVFKKKRNYEEARAVKIHSFSDLRCEPKCSHFGTCGGCKWQNMRYEEQTAFKQQQVEDNLVRIGKLDIPKIETIIAADNIFHYRNKLEYTFGNRRWFTEKPVEGVVLNPNGIGFHLPGMWDRILNVDTCYLQPEPSNAIRLSVRDFAIEKGFSFWDPRNNVGFLRNLVVRNTSTNEWMIMVIFGEDNPTQIEEVLEHIKTNFPEITSLMYVVNLKKNDSYSDLDFQNYSGENYIVEEMDGLKFRIAPVSFFQTNYEQACKLYRESLICAGLTGSELVYDLYTGTGTIANFMARHAKKVVGIEYVEAAIEDAKINSEINSIDNTQFFSGDMAKVLTPDFVEQHGLPDVVITDPPRAGMHKDVVEQLLKMLPKRIVYISCNPATQARDIALISEKYRVVKVQPVDMFPHTHHVENIAQLDLIENN